MKGLTVGRMVHFIEEPLFENANDPSKIGKMKHCAAVVEDVLDEEKGICLLLVMSPGDLREVKAEYMDPEDAVSNAALIDKLIGTWHWIERV
jgi:hypothetical protein